MIICHLLRRGWSKTGHMTINSSSLSESFLSSIPSGLSCGTNSTLTPCMALLHGGSCSRRTSSLGVVMLMAGYRRGSDEDDDSSSVNANSKTFDQRHNENNRITSNQLFYLSHRHLSNLRCLWLKHMSTPVMSSSISNTTTAYKRTMHIIIIFSPLLWLATFGA